MNYCFLPRNHICLSFEVMIYDLKTRKNDDSIQNHHPQAFAYWDCWEQSSLRFQRECNGLLQEGKTT